MLKVSVIVPVYNPGEHFEPCIASLLAQTMPADEHELILVDDGSTDGTGARLDALAAEHAHVRVRHIPNSGWPGRPRNVGTDAARGEYVLYVDHDDRLGPEALERLHARAVADGADVVIGRVVGAGKRVPRELFQRDRSGVTLEWRPLLRLLSPHKLFRRAFLDQHGIRFPEGRRRLEDHLFVMHAYLHEPRISVLASYPCYEWVGRDDEGNASLQQLEPGAYYDDVRDVLDLVAEHTEPGPLRDRLLAHWYRGKALTRVGHPAFLGREPELRAQLVAAVRRLSLERYGPEVERWLTPSRVLRSRLVRAGDLGALERLAEHEARLRADAVARRLELRDGVLELEVDVWLGHAGRGGEPPALVRRGDELLLSPPAGIDAGEVVVPRRELLRVRAYGALRSRRHSGDLPLALEPSRRLEPGPGGRLTPVATLTGRVDPRTAAAGRPLAPGRWRLHVSAAILGFDAETAGIRGLRGGRPGPPRPVTLRVRRDHSFDERAWALRRALRRIWPAWLSRAGSAPAARRPGGS